jgi:mono/diheme cytochrome c family protein
VTEVVSTPNFTLAAGQSIHPRVAPGAAGTWRGLIKVLQAGTYTFSAEVDIGGTRGSTFTLPAGEHAIVLARPTDGRFQLEWESEHFQREPVPARVLGHRDEPAALEASMAIERGHDLVEEHNCMGCHESALAGRKGPDLTHVGSRATRAWLAAWTKNPRHVRATAVMPVLVDDREAVDIATYLATLVDPKDVSKEIPTDAFRRRQGKERFDAVGCAACHGAGGVPLDALGSKTDAWHLSQYLLNSLAVDPSGRMPNLLLAKEDAQIIAEYLTESHRPELEKDPGPGDTTRGRELTRSRGCVGCHTINDGWTGGERQKVPPLALLRGGRGCLAPEPPPTAARYGFTRDERIDIAAFLKSGGPTHDAPVHEFHRRVRQLRCGACHEIDGVSPAVAEPPPPLTDAGNKLRASWAKAVLVDRKRIRPWMQLKMPHFGDAAKPLVDGLAAAAGAPLGDGDPIVAPPFEKVRDGVKLIGKGNDGGLACVACHTFAGKESLGTIGPDMTEMAARMRPEWFRRWMLAPIRLQPGTAMPTYFDGKPADQVAESLDLIWAALAAGKRAPLPPGVGERQPYLLLVKDEPVVIRTMMPDSDSRSIAVGLPVYQSFCFDAEFCQLRYAWQGDFLDVSPVWGGRGGEPARVLGRTWYVASGGSLRAKPDQAPVVKFLGYRLDDKRVPEFRYTIDGIEVAEKITSDGASLTRTFSSAGEVWFLGRDAKGVEITATGGEWVDGRLKASESFVIKVEPKK